MIIHRSRALLLAFLLTLLCTLALPSLVIPSLATPDGSTSANCPIYLDSTQSVDQQGKALFDAGCFPEAIALLQQAAQTYEAQDDKLRQAIALSNLALTYQQLGETTQANDSIAASLALLQLPHLTGDRRSVQAQILDIQGRLQLTQGQPEAALTSWQNAARLYQQSGDSDRLIHNQLDQTRALQTLGLYRWARELLSSLKQTLNAQPDSLTKAAGLRNLGDALRAIGDLNCSDSELDCSESVLQASLNVGQSLSPDPALPAAQIAETIALTQLSLGNTIRAKAIDNLSLNDIEPAEAIAVLSAPVPDQNDLNILEGEIPLAKAEREAAYAFQQQVNLALNFYDRAAQTATSNSTRIQAQLNQLNLLVETERWIFAQRLAIQIQPQIDQLPVSRAAIDSQINFAQSLTTGLEHWTFTKSIPKPQETIFTMRSIAQLLSTAAQQADRLQDERASAYAIGSLGGLYEKNQQWTDAETVTRRALELAQSINVMKSTAADLVYLWQWQLGRILKAQAETSGGSAQDQAAKYQAAIDVYDQALKTLKSLRLDLASADREEQFSFQKIVEPVYRQLIELLLHSAPTEKDWNQQFLNSDAAIQDNLAKARETLQSLQAAELQNFFREGCTATPVPIDEVIEKQDPQQSLKVAVIYPIIQAHKLSVILKIPGQKFFYYETTEDSQVKSELNPQALKEKIKMLRSQLQPYEEGQFKKTAAQLYDWLIRPAIPFLQANKIETLLFALDGSLKNISMAALYDNDDKDYDGKKQYLIESYSVALVPGLQLPEPKRLNPQRIRLLFAGLSESVGSSQVLNSVQDEAREIKSVVPNTVMLIDQNFTGSKLQERIEASPFQIIHIATHGKFSSNLDETFILTAKGKVKLAEFDRILRTTDQSRLEPIELLVLSACQTAKGDERAALGLAGVAVRAGARSTIASLWPVDDSTAAASMLKFYEQLVKGVSKAKALQEMQLSLLNQQKHPQEWAPFILLGNWL